MIFREMNFGESIFNELTRLWHDEQGLTTVEYAIAGGLVSAALVGAFVALGDAVGTSIGAMCKVLKDDGSDC